MPFSASGLKAVIVVVTQPDPPNTEAFLREPGAVRLYMPTWDDCDLEGLRLLQGGRVSKEEVVRLRGIFGGVPRAVLDEAEDWEERKGALMEVGGIEGETGGREGGERGRPLEDWEEGGGALTEVGGKREGWVEEEDKRRG